jgi:hypothetical protein
VRATLLTVLIQMLWPAMAESIGVAPHALFMSDDNRVAEVTLFNSTSAPEEVELDFQYGFPVADSTGRMVIALMPNPGPEDPSAAAWLRAFPRRVRVEPGQRQTVRVQATPPDDLAPGEFWSRMIITSRAASPRGVPVDSAVAATLNIQFRTIISVNYRNQDVNTAVTLDSLWAQVTPDTVKAWVDVGRGGNAAFLGSAVLTLESSNGTVERQSARYQVAVYRPLRRWFALPLEGLAPGEYTLRIALSTERVDLNPDNVLPAPGVERSVRISIP